MPIGRMEDSPSNRILDQRLRNRLMEELLSLSEGDQAVREHGAAEYFESFYDYVRHRGGEAQQNSAFSDDERLHLLHVSAALDDACDATAQNVTVEELIASGWPERIKPLAQAALDVMLKRGRFSEETEEDAPSLTGCWP